MTCYPRLVCVMAIMIMFIEGVTGECPSGWEGWGGSCYLLQRTGMEQTAAVTFCGQYNATLVSIGSSQENQAIGSLIRAASQSNYGQSVKYWTGLQPVGQSYRWSDGTPFSQGAIRVIRGLNSQQCSSWSPDTNNFEFESCDLQYRPLCKRSASLSYIDKCNEEDGWQDINGACFKLFDVTSSWSDAQQQCHQNSGDLYVPGSSSYVINRLVTCRISITHIWLGASDITHPGTILLVNGMQSHLSLEMGEESIIDPGNTCVEAVTTTTNTIRFQTDVCHHEKRFICQKPYGTCPSGWDEHQGRCYQVLTTSLGGTTWFLAKQSCQDLGAQPLIVNSMDEHMFIVNQLIQNNIPSVWLGFSAGGSPDKLQWVDGTPANGSGVFSVWAPGFPHAVANITDCGLLEVGASNGSWSHGYCYDTRPFVCELHIAKNLSPQPPVFGKDSCDAGWTRFRDQCFLFSNSQESWEAASVSCQMTNGHLAIIRDPYVQSFLTLNLPDTGIAWIGAKMDANDHKYYWSDDTPISFANYVPGEPNGQSQGFACLEMVATGSFDYPGGWIDQNCSLPQDYICQKPAVQTSGTSQPTPTYAWSLRCDPGWRLNSRDNLCYLVATDSPKIWLEASYDCQRRGAQLLSISGPNEQLHVEAVLSSAFPTYESFWIGASDSTEEGGWEWSDGSPFRYLHWHPGQPDDWFNAEDCAELTRRWNYQWNDRNCDSSLHYICKKPAKPPPTSPVPTVPTLVPPTKCIYQALISGQYSIQSPFAFTSSSDLDTNHTASHIRLLSDNLLAWRPSSDRVGEWVGVTFYQTMALSSLTLAGELNSFSVVTSFKVQYQYSTHSPWYWVESTLTPTGKPQVFDGPTTDDSSTNVFFDTTIYAQSIRVFPLAWGSHIAVRLELNGCVEESCSMDYAVSGPLVVMEGGFSASSMSDFTHTPHSARLAPLPPLIPPSCWRPGQDFDPASPPWIEVNLGNIKLLRGVTIMGNPDADEYVTLFQLQYRLSDSASNVAYQEPYGVPMNFTGNVDNNSSVTALLKSVIPAKHVRLVALAFHGHVALRFDLLVCSMATCKEIALLSGQHNVSNTAFTASSSRDSEHGPFHSRLGAQALGASGDAWVAKFNDDNQYIQVDLGEKIQVWAVSTQGSDDLGQWVRAYTLAFSLDGHLFSSYSDDGKNPATFDGNFDASSVRKHYLTTPTVARYVQLWPTDYEGAIALRWEVYGCPGPESGQYLGCFLDEGDQRDLPFEPLIDVSAHVGPVSCRYHCYDKGYAYAGLQRGIACYCGNSYGKYGSSLHACTATCLPPFEHETCGGHLANSVYSTGLAPPHEFCEVGWASQGDSCYEVLQDQRTWFDAHEMCRQLGAELVSIRSEVENNFLFSIVSGLAVQGKSGSLWIGLNDLDESYFYQWKDGAEVVYTNWDLHMPVSDPSQEQHCVALNNQTGGWMTVFCEERMMYACKSPKRPSPMPHLPPVIAGCDGSDWSAFRWSCYSVIDQRQSWTSAQRACKTAGATLVRINDRYEQAFVSSLLGSKSGYFWTDVSDTQSPTVFAFSGRSSVTFTSWGSKQPASSHGCVGVVGGNMAGLWYTLTCASLHHAVCEKPRVGFTPAPTQPLVPPGARCPPGWYESHFSCFQVNIRARTQQLTWDEARVDCQNQGADLASFHSHQDLEDVWRHSIAGNDGNFWIGLRYSDQDHSLKWSDGSGVNFVQWATGETDTLQGLKNCGELLVDSGNMAHQFCFALRNWVCSIPRGAVPKPRTTMVAPTAGGPGSCYPLDDRWKSYKGACYLVQAGGGDNALTWREASAWCNQAHTALASITSPLEQLFVYSLIRNVTDDCLWIGLNKLDIGHGFQWSDSTPTAYENWNVNEPNNFGDLEYCVSMLTKNGKWNDDVCTRKKGFVCKQASYLTPAPKPSTTPVYGICPTGYSAFKEEKCLRVYGGSEGEQLLTWEEAWQDCKRRGPGHNLASIDDLEENLQIVTMLGTNQLSAWIGLKRLPDGTFIWTDSSDVTFTNWGDGEPTGGTQSCVYMKGTSSSAGEWSDAPCFQKANYVCQAPKDQRGDSEQIPNPCDEDLGFYPYKDGCYQYVSLGKNYTGAMAECHREGAHLVTVDNAFSQAFLRLFVAHSLGLHFESDEVQTIWIGLNDMQNEGVYQWTLGWPVTYTNWAPGEPSRGPGEGCVSMRPDGMWVDDNCTREISYICAIFSEKYPFTPQPPRGQCSGPEWVAYGDSCYLFRGHDTQTFYEAQLRCQEQQAYLTSVHDNATIQFLVNMMVTQTEFHFWVGLYGSSADGFSWVDLSAVDYTNWATNEPSGTNAEGIVEHCVGFDPRTHQWNDLDCGLRLGYVCRKKQEVDNSVKTRPPVIGPFHSPPTIVPQKTPPVIQPMGPGTTVTPSPRSPSTTPVKTSKSVTSRTVTSRPVTSTPVIRPSQSSGSSTPSGLLPTKPVKTSRSVTSRTVTSTPVIRPSGSSGSSTPSGLLPTKQASTGSNSGLSSSAVAGIVVSVLLVVTAGIVATLFFIRRRRQRPPQSSEGSHFSNVLYDFGSTYSSERSDVQREEVSLGVIVSNRDETVGADTDGALN